MKSYKLISFLLIVFIFAGFQPSPAGSRDFLVAIDIGHNPNQPGAVSARGVGEYFFNKHIAEGVHARITAQKNNLKSFLINNPAGGLTLRERTRIAAEKKADLLISIHHDSVQPELLSSWEYQGAKQSYCDRYKGFSLFYSEWNADPYHSLLFALLAGTEMLKNKLTPSLHHAEKMKGENRAVIDELRGIYKFNELVVLKTATMPAVLLECGIIVNRDEELKMGRKECQEIIINAITGAINKYWQLNRHTGHYH